MKILSIDVGIKNLAYCIFFIPDKIKSNGNFEIDSWDVVNICKTTKDHTCCFNNNTCKRKPKLFRDSFYYCKIHAKKSKYIIPSDYYNLSKIKKSKLSIIKQFCIKEQINIEYCKRKIDYVVVMENYFKHRLLEPVVHKRADSINLIILGRNMNTIFNTIFNKHEFDYVIIENQIGIKASRMKTLQGMIAQYFIMKNVPYIEFISSYNKLKEFIGEKQKLTYKEKKTKGIEVMYDFFKNNCNVRKWEPLFSKHKKKR